MPNPMNSFMCVHVCMCVYIYTYYILVLICMYVCVCICVHAKHLTKSAYHAYSMCVYIRICYHSYINVPYIMYMNTCIVHTSVNTHTCICMYRYIHTYIQYIHTYIQAYIYTNISTYMHAYTHTYIHTLHCY